MAHRLDYRLRLLDRSDLDRVLEWRNSDRVRANMCTDHLISPAEHLAWFERISQSDTTIYRMFEFQYRPIGLVNLSEFDRCNNKGSWAFYLGETDVPLGSGSRMAFLFLEYVFEHLKIRKLCSEVLVFNQKSVKLHQKFGFQEEGRLKQHIFKNGEYQDVIRLALFQHHWVLLKPQVEELCFEKK